MPASRIAAALGLLYAGCFAPEPREGLPCSAAGDCPPGQDCRAGVCASGERSVDAAVTDAPPADAAVVAPPAPFGEVVHVPLTCPGAVPCADVRDPFLAAGGTALLFTYLVPASAGNANILVAAAGEAGFGQAASVGAINSAVIEHSAFLSPDGASLWFAREDVSAGVPMRPYDQILISRRPGGVGTFDTAVEVPGAVNTPLGDERSPQVLPDEQVMLFTRASEEAATDHDVYLARFAGAQWDTIERVAALSAAGVDDHAVALALDRKAVFFIRGGQIHEAIWTGEDPGQPALIVVHDELDAAPLDGKVGLWVSPDGDEIWFDSSRSGTHQIYRAVR